VKKYFVLCLLLAVILSIAGAEDLSLKILVPKLASSIPFLEIELRDAREDLFPGIQVEVEFFANHAQALARLLNGEVALIYTGASTGWQNHFSGGPVIMISTGIWGVSSIVGSSPEYQSLQDLVGKKVALPFPGAPLDLQMRYILEKNGINPDEEIQIVYAPFPQAAGQILSGQIDAAPLPEPLATTMVENKGLNRYERVQDAWAKVAGGDPLSPQVSLYTTVETYNTIAGVLPQLVTEWGKMSEYTTSNPEEAAESHAERLGFQKSIVAQSIGNTILLVLSREENRSRVTDYIAIMAADPDKSVPEDLFFAEY
jgi:NitT/TauT family transport system substrate-binding protein